MRVKIVSNEEAMIYLFSGNPLLVRGDNGALMYFPSEYQCYYEFMSRFYIRFAKGYCDPVLWLHEAYSIPLKEADHVFNLWRNRFGKINEPILIEWSNEAEAIKYLKFFMTGVLTFTGNVLCERIFNIAFDTFSKNFNIKIHEQ